MRCDDARKSSWPNVLVGKTSPPVGCGHDGTHEVTTSGHTCH